MWRLRIQVLHKIQNQVQFQEAGALSLYKSPDQVQVVWSSVLPGCPAVHVVELSDGGQLPPGEIVDADGHSRSSEES